MYFISFQISSNVLAVEEPTPQVRIRRPNKRDSDSIGY